MATVKRNLKKATSTTTKSSTVGANPSVSPLLSAISQETSWKLTENGASALSSTSSPIIDLFGQMGALRSRSEQDIICLFTQAFLADPLLALKALFYARDARGGLGERRVFRIIARHLAFVHPDIMRFNIHHIPFYGRYDDLYIFVGTPLESDAFEILHDQYISDLTSLAKSDYTNISLLAKWLKSENTSSSESRRLARATIAAFQETPSTYRKNVASLRRALKVTETLMSASRWSDINYSAVPSIAMKSYRNAFFNHDQERFMAFNNDALSGKVKINSSALYPYDIILPYVNGRNVYGFFQLTTLDPTLEAQWKALPNYLSPSDRFLVMVDTSGSMMSPACRPLATSVSLGIYFAEHSTGPFANHFLTFTDTPHLVSLPSSPTTTLLDKVTTVLDDNYVGYNTNLEAAFEAVLKSALRSHCSPEDLPTAIVIISDMEIDDFGQESEEEQVSFTEKMSKRFASHGYKMPTLVYWNVNARASTFHATDKDDVRFVSGSSPTVFEGLCKHLGSSPFELILETLGNPRYDNINLPKGN